MMNNDRKRFEKWLAETHGLFDEDVAFDDKRNCYVRFDIHLACQAWRESGKHSALVVIPNYPGMGGINTHPQRAGKAYAQTEILGRTKEMIVAQGFRVKHVSEVVNEDD
ncbi:hypothetical protein JA116_17045 [Morganella morganii]|uniref:hypothetical protein n=1 Tax=Morganella morganii TaxID=582 RepID=UPI000D1F53A3|nr:hypothetical protein [Morganella morganii]QXO42266.1 hypothetical protein CXB74_017155 [Morganella morganii]QXO45898.1 hypothetical protein JC862_16580 [Morganella morganii]QXO49569.1 hypothetical protein JC861_17400 [Morganella morganii]QXO53428.1 hypothetical protein JC830_17415 [Morganella morganii]QXO80068.1 hypothetical protein JA116_17045 [Morganella morganii]